MSTAADVTIADSTIADINVWLALLVAEHEHHARALRWFDSLAPLQAGMCRFAQLGVVRLLATAAVMEGKPVPAAEGWQATKDLLADERVIFIDEPIGFDAAFEALLGSPVPAPKQVGDLYLATLALAAGCSLTTFDRGFKRVRGLAVALL